MTLSTIPEFPAIGDASFNSKAYAFGTALTGTFRTEINALETNVNAKEVSAAASAAAALLSKNDAATSAASAAAYANATGTSTTSMLIGLGAKAFTGVESGRSWVAGMPVIARYDASNYMLCTVTSYSGTNLTLNCVAVVGSGTYSVWSFFAMAETRLPILSAASVSLNAKTSCDDIYDSYQITGLTGPYGPPLYGNGLFVVASTVSSANVATSPDGITWTLRAMPSTAIWVVRNNGSNFFAAVPGATTTAKSTNGTTWSSATALPTAMNNDQISMTYSSAGVILLIATGSSGEYVSTDNGTTWSSLQAMHTGAGHQYLTVGGLLMSYQLGASSYFTSSTGLAGSWTSRSFPRAFVAVTGDGNGALVLTSYFGTLGNAYRCTDGINWTDLGFVPPLYVNNLAGLFSVNGVWVQHIGAANTFGTLFSRHNGKWVMRNSISIGNVGVSALGGGPVTNGSGVWIGTSTSGSSVARIEPSLNTAMGYFSPL